MGHGYTYIWYTKDTYMDIYMDMEVNAAVDINTIRHCEVSVNRIYSATLMGAHDRAGRTA